MVSNGFDPAPSGCLYLVSTPIGNLEDVTYRAIDTLGRVELIAAEDTRKTRILLDRYGIKNKLTSFNARNGSRKTPGLVDLLKNGQGIALVSEAGTPGVSDPGAIMVRAALDSGIRVVSIPGPSSVTAAVAVSGLPGGTFHFFGFLPKRAGRRKRILETAAGLEGAVVLFEPTRSLVERLEEIEKIFGDRLIVVCRELTKVYEEVKQGRISEMLAYYRANPPRGEATLVIAPPSF